ncbi:unnamed protein product, partial [Gulo gulo]
MSVLMLPSDHFLHPTSTTQLSKRPVCASESSQGGSKGYLVLINANSKCSVKEDTLIRKLKSRATGWLSQLSNRVWLRSRSQGLGIESHVGLSAQRGACFPLHQPLLPPAHSLSLSQINKS